jgi:hypothetical protein
MGLIFLIFGDLIASFKLFIRKNLQKKNPKNPKKINTI